MAAAKEVVLRQMAAEMAVAFHKMGDYMDQLSKVEELEQRPRAPALGGQAVTAQGLAAMLQPGPEIPLPVQQFSLPPQALVPPAESEPEKPKKKRGRPTAPKEEGDFRTGQWLDFEEEQLLDAIKEYGLDDVENIRKKVPSRRRAQIKRKLSDVKKKKEELMQGEDGESAEDGPAVLEAGAAVDVSEATAGQEEKKKDRKDKKKKHKDKKHKKRKVEMAANAEALVAVPPDPVQPAPPAMPDLLPPGPEVEGF